MAGPRRSRIAFSLCLILLGASAVFVSGAEEASEAEFKAALADAKVRLLDGTLPCYLFRSVTLAFSAFLFESLQKRVHRGDYATSSSSLIVNLFRNTFYVKDYTEHPFPRLTCRSAHHIIYTVLFHLS